jgi:hypothetical protein
MKSHVASQLYYLVIALAPLLDAGPGVAQARQPLEPVQTIALPDVRGRIDHLDIDLDGERLFVAALGNDTVEVIDLHAGQRSARLEHLQEPQGVAYVPEAKRLFVANGRSGRVDIFEGASLADAGHVDGLEDADNVRYEPNSGHVYVGYGNALATIDAATLKLAAQTKLAGHPESFQVEGGTSRIFVNVPSAQHIAIVDRTTGRYSRPGAWSTKKRTFPWRSTSPTIDFSSLPGSLRRFWFTTPAAASASRICRSAVMPTISSSTQSASGST